MISTLQPFISPDPGERVSSPATPHFEVRTCSSFRIAFVNYDSIFQLVEFLEYHIKLFYERLKLLRWDW